MLDVAALQRELDAGVSPDLTEDVAPALSRLPLQDAIEFGSGARPPESIHERLACIEALLEAGASVDATAGGGRTGGFLRRNQNGTTRAIDALDDFHTGGFKGYEKAHRQRLTATFLAKFPSLPAEIVSHIVSFGFNCGCY